MAFTYQKMIAMMAVRNCYLSGSAIPVIAKQAGKSTTTIRRWLKDTHTLLRPGDEPRTRGERA
jgi:transposase